MSQPRPVAGPMQPEPDPATLAAAALADERRRLTRTRRKRAELDLAARRGDLMPVAEARVQICALASAVRRQLDLAPAYLPADLTPEAREAATLAMRGAIRRALSELDAGAIRADAVRRGAEG